MNKLQAIIIAIIGTQAHAHRIVLTGVPKSGINAATQVIKPIINSKKVASVKGDMLLVPEQMQQLGKKYDLLVGTPVYNEHNVRLIEKYDAKIICMVRNPHGQLASTAQTIHTYRRHVPPARNKNLDQILMDLITDGSAYYAVQYAYDEVHHVHGIAHMYALWLPWLEHPNVLVVRYENLINETTRAQEIQRIANFLGVSISKQKAQEISRSSFGGFFGFFKKKPSVDGWKKIFKSQHIQAFNQHAHDLMIELGYA